MTLAATKGMHSLGLLEEDVLAVIQSIEPQDFYKSMTSYADHTIWQDVYHVPWESQVIYLKFTADRRSEFRILSFKGKS